MSTRPRLLDLFCCAGGAAMGYYRAGFDVIGIDRVGQPNYPFVFMQHDAIAFLKLAMPWIAEEFDAIHASPPCQHYLNLTRVNAALGRAPKHKRLIAETRELLRATGLPFVIENGADAKPGLIDPVRICGTSFELPLRRHRLFESNVELVGTACEHSRFTEKRYWTGWSPGGKRTLSTVVQVYGNAGGTHEWPAAMGIDWMTNREMAEAIPPAYTEHIGRQLLEHLQTQRAA